MDCGRREGAAAYFYWVPACVTPPKMAGFTCGDDDSAMISPTASFHRRNFFKNLE